MEESRKQQIRETARATKLKRKFQKCKVFQLKIDSSKLNKVEKEKLKMFFVEAKWFYNDIIASGKPFTYDYKIKEVKVKNKNGEFEIRKIKHLLAKPKQDLVYRSQQAIKVLSVLKKSDKKVGRLKFKSELNCIDFSQYGVTHKIVNNRFKLNGIRRHLHVHGLHQIKPEYELANVKLIQKPSGYYIHLVTYETINSTDFIENKKAAVGLDFGIKNNITTSDKEVFNCSIGESERLKRLQRKLSRQQKGSNNRYKTRRLLRLEYENITNKKKDKSNKLVNHLFTSYHNVYMQDEDIKGWHEGWFGKQVQQSYLGMVKYKLLEHKNKSVHVVDKYFPSTKWCFKCDNTVDMPLGKEVFECSCGYKEDRDIKAAKTILYVGRCKNEYVPREPRNLKPVESVTGQTMKQEAQLVE